MPWIQLRIPATEQTAEPISDYLSEVGAQAVTFMDAKDTPIYEPAIGEVKYWNNTIVTGLFDGNDDIDSIIATLKHQPLFKEQFHYKIEALEDKDWEREWMDNFHPMKFGKRLWICPSWRDIPDPTAVNLSLIHI